MVPFLPAVDRFPEDEENDPPPLKLANDPA
jgi:hypothetical protein